MGKGNREGREKKERGNGTGREGEKGEGERRGNMHTQLYNRIAAHGQKV